MVKLDLNNALIPYYTFADPNPDFSKKLVVASFEAGADAVELGIPFSDPIADGPVIQASHQRALEKHPDLTIKDALALVADVKTFIFKPLLFMMDANLILQFGVEGFFKSAHKAKLDGVIIPNLPVEEADEFQKFAKQYKIAMILLVSPMSDEKRVKKIAKASSGFVYLISSTGTTGERATISKGLNVIAKQIKKVKDIPVIVGFGVSKPEHFEAICKYADGAIVGTHFIKLMEPLLKTPEKAIQKVVNRIKKIKAAV